MAGRGLLGLPMAIWYMCVICFIQRVDFAWAIFASGPDLPHNDSNSKGKLHFIFQIMYVCLHIRYLAFSIVLRTIDKSKNDTTLYLSNCICFGSLIQCTPDIMATFIVAFRPILLEFVLDKPTTVVRPIVFMVALYDCCHMTGAHQVFTINTCQWYCPPLEFN